MLILFSSFSVHSQIAKKDTSQSAKDILKQQRQIDSLTREFEKVKNDNYDKAIDGSNRSIFISTLVVIFVTFIAIIVGIFGFLRIREIRSEFKETQKELKERFEEEIKNVKRRTKEAERICDRIEEQGKFVDEQTENFRKKMEIQEKSVPMDYLKEISAIPKVDSKTAIQEYEKIMNKIFNEETYSTMAYNYYTEGRYEECISELRKLIEMNPERFDAYYNWGVALGKLNKPEEAIEKYKKALELKPDYVDALYNIASVYSLQKKKVEALENLKKAIELDPAYKDKAKTDEDFKNLWEDEDFKKLVE